MKERKLFELYPEEGPLRRELYTKHIEFFAAGALHNERAFVGGNRCITPWTAIETDRATRLAGEIIGEEVLNVRSWADGSRCTKRASGVFLKSIEPAFHVVLDNGQAFQATYRHRLLVIGGTWHSLGQIVQHADGLRCSQIIQDYRANCDADDHRNDVPSRSLLDSGLGQLQAKGDVRPTLQIFEPQDVVEQKQAHSRPYPTFCHLSTQDGLDHLAGLSSQFSDPTEHMRAQWSSRKLRAIRQLALESGREKGAPKSHQDTLGSLSLYDAWNRHLDAVDKSRQIVETIEVVQQFGASSTLEQPILEWLHGEVRTRIFVPSRHIPLAGGQHIVAVIPLGYQPIVDLSVEDTECYEIGGVIHHNTGKSFCICYEGTCHLTGWYPEWWVGRRYDRPTVGWAAGEDVKAVRESLQPTLIGPADSKGTGLIPAANIMRAPAKSGVPDALDFVDILHKSGGKSRLLFKAYEQGRESFQASQIDFALLDEEPPLPIYTETLTRTMSTVPGTPNGLVLCAFTPLKGISATVLQFLPGGAYPATEELRKAAWGW